MKFQIVSIAIVFVTALAAHAQVLPPDSQEAETRDKIELPESSPSSPPLSTDDAGTPGAYGVEVNLIESSDSSVGGQNISTGIDANFGIGDQVQLRYSKESFKQKVRSEPDFNGYGASSVAVKWRFYNNSSQTFKLAIYPSYQFDDETHPVGTASEGRNIYVPLIAAFTFGRSTLIANLGFTKNLDYVDQRSSFSSLALGHALSETLRISTELVSQKSLGGEAITWGLGFVKEIFPNEKSNYETAFFGSVGRNVGWTIDQQDHLNVLFGITIAHKGK
ncbi:MAG: hypothetical protein H7061_09285 [Bdellovibrionaceae bacterium]|nr:hypothetical protein [Bdellovibrio sp.]